jgi:hypothetical protein
MEELAGLSADARKLALDRFQLLRPHLEESQSLQSVASAAGISISNCPSVGHSVSPIWVADLGWNTAQKNAG